MSLQILALEHQRKRTELSGRVAREAARLWRSVETDSIDAGWDRIAPQLERLVFEGQLRSARMAPSYTAQVAREQGVPARAGDVVPESFAGATLEGRAVVPELFAAATVTKRLIGRGAGVGQAFRVGTALMSVLAATMVRDAGTMADKVSGVSRARSVRYARMVSPGACSRCAILAGVGHFTKHFERHPGCRCTTVPVYSDADAPLPEGLFANPSEYFESLSKREQERVFTKAGAEAIRLGADPIRVVNVRRGMYRVRQPGSLVARATPRMLVGPDGKPFTAYVTVDARKRFGAPFRVDGSRRTSMVRLMPETIMSQASSPAEAVELLKRFGYIP